MTNMAVKKLVLISTLLCLAAAQTMTLTGCHMHGAVEHCYLPNGSEVPFTRTGTPAAAAATKTTAPATAQASATSAAIPASVTGCHLHETTQFCIANGTEYQVVQTPAITPLPTEYTDCHAHGTDIFCMASDGSEVQIALGGAELAVEGETSTEAKPKSTSTTGTNCHFHGNVEHCTGGSAAPAECALAEHDYDMGLRIGLIFVIFAGSTFAVFSPLLLERFTKYNLNGVVFTILKQFGTGVIISTAFVHLLSHAQIMFANECLTTLIYESTATSIAMAGVFLCFLVEYLGYRVISRRQRESASDVNNEQQFSESPKASTPTRELIDTTPNTTLAALGHNHGANTGPDNHFNLAVMESGIVFHSILIGITLNVTPDSYYMTFFIVILFHQMFEGIALGTRIAALQSRTPTLTKFLMASLFALITPVGMAIGAGVLHRFNGNDPSTIIALGTLDALSAGILLWVGLVEMLAHDWMHGDMAGAKTSKVLIGVASLMTGMGLMSFLGKWA